MLRSEESRRLGRSESQVEVGRRGRHSPPRRPLHQSTLDEERLVGILNGRGLLTHRLRQRRQSHRSASEAATEGVEDLTIELV